MRFTDRNFMDLQILSINLGIRIDHTLFKSHITALFKYFLFPSIYLFQVYDIWKHPNSKGNQFASTWAQKSSRQVLTLPLF